MILASCSENEDFTFKTKGLTVFYSNKKDSSKVYKLADYWKKNNLLTSKHQYIRLVHTSDSLYYLQLILSDNENVKNLTFNDLKLIQNLENDLNKNVFLNSIVKIKITDKSFDHLK